MRFFSSIILAALLCQGGLVEAVAKGASESPAGGLGSLGAIQCIEQETSETKHLAPTGCISPFPECQVNLHKGSILQSCRSASTRPACQNFTWEKCCFVSCNQRDSDKRLVFGLKENCMGVCMSAQEAEIFTPNAAANHK